MTNGFVNSTFGNICVEMAFYLNRVVIPKRNLISDRNDAVMIDVGKILKESLRTVCVAWPVPCHIGSRNGLFVKYN